MNKYIPHTDADIKEMLETIGVSSIDDLFTDLPEGVKLNREFNMENGLSELEVTKIISDLASKNKSELAVFMGAGAYDHYIPSIVHHLILRSEFYTAYTPYQPEISQGTLQYIFEFQTMIANLTGMYVSNASMYDGPTATAEAMFMATAAKRKNKILVSETINPNIKKVMETYAKFRSIEVVYVGEENGVTNVSALKELMETGEYAGLVAQNPNFYGIIEDYTEVIETVHSNKGLMIMNVDPMSLSIVKTPGEMDVDIVCGEAQSFGIPLNYGGPYLGFLCTNKKLLRKMPGRICGETTDVDGKRAYVLTLQAREQHIRRDKANSNICSNQSLNALVATIYLSTMGKEGLKDVASRSLQGAHYLYNKLIETGKFNKVYDKPFYKEFVVSTDLDVDQMNEKLLENNILGGYHLKEHGKEGHILFCVTEKRTKEEIDKLVEILGAM